MFKAAHALVVEGVTVFAAGSLWLIRGPSYEILAYDSTFGCCPGRPPFESGYQSGSKLHHPNDPKSLSVDTLFGKYLQYKLGRVN